MKKSVLFFILLLFTSTLASAQETSAPLLEAFRGNWFADRIGWALGVYDSVVIANNRIYTCEQVRRQKKGVELTLRDKQSGRTQVMRLNTRKNGTCRMIQDDEVCEMTRDAQPAAVLADNGYDPFFRADTATLQGFINGYTPDLGFESGMIYLRNPVTGEELPTVVSILPDGTFTVRLPLQHPMLLSMLFNDEWFSFFIEPGQTQTMYLDWADVLTRDEESDNTTFHPGTRFMGSNAHLSYLAMNLDNIPGYDYSNFPTKIRTLTPTQFKESLKPDTDCWQQKGDSLVTVYGASQKAVKLIRHKVALMEGFLSFYYTRYRPLFAQREPNNKALNVPITADFYDFLHRMPLDDPEVLACDKVESLPYRLYQDSLAATFRGTDKSFLWQVADILERKSNLTGHETYESLQTHKEQQKEACKEYPYLVACVDKLYSDLQAKLRADTYELPEEEGTDIFRRIIRENEGKVLFVDFWATWCGYCLQGIEYNADLRRKYKDHPDVKFIFISGGNEASRSEYDKYVDEHLRGETTYYLSEKEFSLLRQLFRFSAIPHYELVEKDGTISRDHVDANSLRSYLNDRFPLEE